MPENFAGGLSAQTRTKVCEILNERLADQIALTLAVKQAHWTLKGPGFIGVHELLDEVADRLREGADLMAERVTTLCGFPHGTAEAVAEKATLKAYPTEEEDIAVHVRTLTDLFKDQGEKVRKAIEAAGDAGDSDTEDLFTEVSRQLDKDAWFIGANAKP
ncbi:DNA starvation/stationary phase protection protein Dps [Wenxinia marina]|uniref:DNA-binding ferritin-like protein (Oxidative damage protectant) n=1 Tax=Wenxinia marina DSM 24838 TaxID=1123501 RepID=A0A0D0QJF6_9RHOB|nr:DNA starvation/stationary phase protection protein Dps [Wenxinia marina]KIQ71153.1 DNA-binding ferritin-like protein (oxidative damage protectant) [Wenxinia marina DSM 24838]GGL54413.1 DNA protection during starvation protein [Wenxinia marina]